MNERHIHFADEFIASSQSHCTITLEHRVMSAVR
jgi:hypothetical protein